MTDRSTSTRRTTIGIDLGDRTSHVCVVDDEGEVVETGTFATTPSALHKRFERCEPSRIAIEAGGQSAWVEELLSELGHAVVVANARRLRMIYENDSKSDEVDAEQLARVARLDVKLLHPIQHRRRSTRVDLTTARSRDALVAMRTALINHVRGILKSFGGRLGSRGAAYFHGWARERIPEELRVALDPVLDVLESVVAQIKRLDGELERLARDVYPETALLRQVDRVGLHTALRFVLTVEDPGRIRRSRDVAAYFGLRPRRRQSGMRAPALGSRARSSRRPGSEEEGGRRGGEEARRADARAVEERGSVRAAEEHPARCGPRSQRRARACLTTGASAQSS